MHKISIIFHFNFKIPNLRLYFELKWCKMVGEKTEIQTWGQISSQVLCQMSYWTLNIVNDSAQICYLDWCQHQILGESFIINVFKFYHRNVTVIIEILKSVSITATPIFFMLFFFIWTVAIINLSHDYISMKWKKFFYTLNIKVSTN